MHKGLSFCHFNSPKDANRSVIKGRVARTGTGGLRVRQLSKVTCKQNYLSSLIENSQSKGRIEQQVSLQDSSQGDDERRKRKSN